MSPSRWKKVREGSWGPIDPGAGGRPPGSSPKRSGDEPEINYEVKRTRQDEDGIAGIFEVLALAADDIHILDADISYEDTWIWEEPTVALGEGRFDPEELNLKQGPEDRGNRCF